MKKGLLTVVLSSAFILGGMAVPTLASTMPEGAIDLGEKMYAISASVGEAKSRLPELKKERIDVNNAVQNSSSSQFYSVGAHNYSRFTFGNTFYNVNGVPDINFEEVTWGNYWHEEAVEVYLINPVIKTCKGTKARYMENDLIYADSNEGVDLTDADKDALANDNLYFAGVAYNKMVSSENALKYQQYENDRLSEISGEWNRTFEPNEISRDGDRLITGFNLPKEVISAEGIVLVDITEKVNKEFYGKTIAANDDGFDLSAISVYKTER